MERATSVSVVVPVYNSAGTLPVLVERVGAALEALEVDYELVLVNDGSTDDSWDRICALADAHPFVRGLDLMRNFGQHNALLAGIRAVERDVVVTMDDDLQNPPEEIGRLVARLGEGYDVVYGTSTERPGGLWRNIATRATKTMLRAVVGSEIASKVSAFRAFRADLRGSFESFRGPDVSIDVLLSWGARRYAAVDVSHPPRLEGRSNYTFGRLATHALNVMTGFSTRPLRLASLLGLAMTLFGAVILMLVLVRYFVEGNPVPGFPFLASIVTIFSGTQLLTLGIIGEYLSRMHVRIMERPAYAVREEVGAAETARSVGES